MIAIVGPTASGKSALAMRVAERIGGEIVSADSRQVYRGMDIGTAKPSVEERARVPHHLIDVVDPGQAAAPILGRRVGSGSFPCMPRVSADSTRRRSRWEGSL